MIPTALGSAPFLLLQSRFSELFKIFGKFCSIFSRRAVLMMCGFVFWGKRRRAKENISPLATIIRIFPFGKLSLISIVFFKRIVYNINVVRICSETASEIPKKGENYELQKHRKAYCGSGAGGFALGLREQRRKLRYAVGRWKPVLPVQPVLGGFDIFVIGILG